MAQLLVLVASFSSQLPHQRSGSVLARPLQVSTWSSETHSRYGMHESVTSFLSSKLVKFSQIENDTRRRAAFDKFLTKQATEEHAISNGPWNRKTSPFANQVDHLLSDLGQLVQDQAWDTHVVVGFHRGRDPLEEENTQLWACVDMLVQFKIATRLIEEQLAKPKTKTKKNCGVCALCSCGQKKQKNA